MALIPLKQTVTVTPASGGFDEWGEPVQGAPYTLKARIQEGVKLTRRQSSANGVNGVTAEEVVSTAQIYLDKLVNISLDDTITYTDENGVTRVYKPISIEVKRGLNGKALFTVVNV